MQLDKMIEEITVEKGRLEKLTKKLGQTKHSNTKKSHKHTKTSLAESTSPSQSPSTQLQTLPPVDSNLQLQSEDFKNVPKETINRVIELLKNYVNMDKSFRLKHESLKTLYNAYLDLYKKYKASTKESNNHDDMLKNIHSEMKVNNSNLYKERLSIIKKIKEHEEIDKGTKDKLCGRLINIFNEPPIPEYKPLALLDKGTTNDNPVCGNKKIAISELDDAYLQRHNELMTVFKAYKNLYSKVLNYKEQLDKYKKLPTSTSISRCEMEKMIKDQRFVMNMIDKMQNNMADNKILSDSEKVLVTPVASNPENINAFNDTMRNQIRHIIDRQVDINPGTKNNIENLLQQYRGCEGNDSFCKAGRDILLLNKN